MNRLLLLIAALSGTLAPVLAPAAQVRAPHIEAELIAEDRALVPGRTQWLALRLAPDAGWHTYWRNPGDSGLPTRIQWQLPSGLSAGEIHWPAPETFSLGPILNYGYSHETLHLVPVTVAETVLPGQTLNLNATAKWLVCADVCIPGSAELSLNLPVANSSEADPAWAQAFADTRKLLPREPQISGQFQIANGEVHLALATGELSIPPSASAALYPLSKELLNHSQPQRLRREADQLRFSQPLSDFFGEAPAQVEAVLVIGDEVPRAYPVRLQPGEVQPVAAPLDAGVAGEAMEPSPISLAWVLALAFIGGLILNLMPCVLPVLAIKALTLVEAQGEERARQRGHTLVYTAGVVASCVSIAALLLLARAGGEAAGWGFQLQSPIFVALMAYLLFALGLSLSGVVAFGTQLMGVGQHLTQRSGYSGSFATGVLAVVVASPCTAPFMGTALGYAMTQNAAVALLVFATLGLGLAAPFLLIGFVPGAARWLPKPGAWMETFKQVMAFPLYLTVVWLVWVLGRQTGANGIAVAGLGLVLVAFALWLWGRRTPGESRWAAALAVISLVAAVGLLSLPELRHGAAAASHASSGDQSEPYTAERLASLRAEGRTVFINMTADWCLSCLANERVALSSDAVQSAFADGQVAYLKGDWTNGDPAITAVLEQFGRNGVPLYVVYHPGQAPQLLPQILTPDIVLTAIKAPNGVIP